MVIQRANSHAGYYWSTISVTQKFRNTPSAEDCFIDSHPLSQSSTSNNILMYPTSKIDINCLLLDSQCDMTNFISKPVDIKSSCSTDT